MQTAINQVFLNNEEESDFKAQMRVLEQEKLREDIEAAIDEELIIAHSAQIISLFSNNPKIADHEDELSVDFISSLISQGVGNSELEDLLTQALDSVSANISKDKSSVKKQMAKVFELLAVLERTVKLAQKPEQLQSSLRQMQEKVRDLAKGGNVENIQKFLKEGELKAAIQQGAELAAKKPEIFRNAAADVSSKIQENQQRAAQQQSHQQKPELAKQNPEIKENAARQWLNKIVDKGRDLLSIDKATASESKPQLQNAQLQNGTRSMQDKGADLAKSGNVENIQKLPKEGELKTAIKQSIEVAAKKPETSRSGTDEVSSKIRGNQQRGVQPQQSQQTLPQAQPQQLHQTQLVQSASSKLQPSQQIPQTLQNGNLQINSQTRNNLMASNPQANQSIVIPRIEPAISPQAKVAPPVENIVPIKTNNIQPQPVQPVAQTKPDVKAEVKPEVKPDEKPPTKAHVHSGNCCDPKQEQIKETVKTMSEDIKRAVDKEITPQRREEIQSYATNGAKSTEAKYVQNTSAESQKEAKAAFGYN